jgi:hypothetical protein
LTPEPRRRPSPRLPHRETEKDWDTDLAEDIKGEVEAKYGPVLKIKVEKESQVHPGRLAACTTRRSS